MRKEQRKERRRLAAQAALGLAALGAASLLALRLGGKGRYDGRGIEARLARLERRLEQGVDVALIGNSVLASAVDADVLRDRLRAAGREGTFLAQDGAASAFWYLTLKNYLCRSARPPRLVVFFILRDELTDPTDRTTGEKSALLRAAGGAWEPELLRVLLAGYARERRGTEALLLVLRALWPPYACKPALRDRLFETLTEWPAAQLRRWERWRTLPTYAQARRALFPRWTPPAGGEPRDGASRPLPCGEAAFAAAVERSFLPAIERLCAERGMRCGVVRLSRRRDAGAGGEQGLEPYMQRLAARLRERGGCFLDLSAVEELDETCYADGIHLNERGRAAVTPRLATWIIEALSERPPAAEQEQP